MTKLLPIIMSGNELREKRICVLQASQSELAAALHVQEQTIRRWEQNKTPIPFLAQHFIKQMLNNHLNKDNPYLNDE